jgi:HEAT repeat protein
MPTPRTFSLLAALVAATLTLPVAREGHAQTTPPAQTPTQDADTPDGQVVGAPSTPQTPGQLKSTAWTLLTTASADPKHTDARIQALAALGLMGDNPRSLKLIEATMSDPDLDVRTAAILAAAQTRASTLLPGIRRLLNDKEPQVAFTAALSLWRLGDPAGQDILMAVLDGDRRASATLLNGAEHDMDRTLHSPSELARIGVTQGAGFLLGPFGFGITAYEYIHKNGGSSARVEALQALSDRRSEPLRKQLTAALADKDPGIRAAAAKALDRYREPGVPAAIAPLLYDPKQPVRLTAAAAYLIATGASPASPDPNAKPDRHHR